MLGEEGGVDAADGRLLGHCLGAVLTELDQVRFARLWPRATRAVEALVLVDQPEGPVSTRGAGLLQDVGQPVHDTRDTGRCSLGFAYP
jgi:hypothetical protein